MQSIYFIGVGGSGMQPLARFAKARGLRVSGSDSSLSQTQRVSFEKEGISAYPQADPDRLRDHDTVVYSSAIPQRHPEREYGRRLQRAGRLVLLHRMDFLNVCLQECETCFAVAGTHGKTSSTAMLGWLLLQSNLDPAMLVGGRPLYLDHGHRMGSVRVGLYETDESDGSFMKSQAQLRLVLNLGEDHLEHYGSLAALKQAFRSFCLAGELIAINASDPNLAQLAAEEALRAKGVFFSCFADSKEMGDFVDSKAELPHHYTGHFEKKGDTLHIFYKACSGKGLEPLGRLQLRMPGRHFAFNALGVLALLAQAQAQGQLAIADGDPARWIRFLNTFPGVERRLEQIGTWKGAAVYDDYGHHPTEIRAVLEALRGRMQGRGRLIAVFQPHRYSRTEALYAAFARVLSLADEVFLLPIYAAGEKPRSGISSGLILESMKQPGRPLVCSRLSEENMRKVFLKLEEGDVLIGLGAGTISQILRQSLASQNIL